jgi:hypothetical protein
MYLCSCFIDIFFLENSASKYRCYSIYEDEGLVLFSDGSFETGRAEPTVFCYIALTLKSRVSCMSCINHVL